MDCEEKLGAVARAISIEGMRRSPTCIGNGSVGTKQMAERPIRRGPISSRDWKAASMVSDLVLQVYNFAAWKAQI
jgi:hypothetical protein